MADLEKFMFVGTTIEDEDLTPCLRTLDELLDRLSLLEEENIRLKK